MKIRSIALPAASAFLAIGLLPATAHAGSNSALSSTAGATARFIASGDSITVCDTAADGESVYAQYKINGGSTVSTSQWNGGNNTCGSRGTGDPAGVPR